MEFTLLASALTGVAMMWGVLRITNHAADFDRLVGVAAVGLVSGRLVAMVAAGVNPLVHPIDVLVVRGGVDTVGAAAGALAFLAWSVRGNRVRLDDLAPAAVAGMAGWHGGCVWRNACLGAAGEVPWGWALSGSSTVRHPVELYAAGLMALGAIALVRLPVGWGVRATLAVALVAGARLITEPLRPSLGGGTGWWYAGAMAAALVAAGYLTVRHMRMGPTTSSSTA